MEELILKWQFTFDNNFKISTTKKIVNTKTNHILKESVNGGYTNGYWFGKKFIAIKDLRQYLQAIPEQRIFTK